MTGFRYEDIFATKHLEYLLVIGFLALLVVFWRFLHAPARGALETAPLRIDSLAGWFSLPKGFYFHQGHSWAFPEGNLVKVGIDDFAQKIIGPVNAIDIGPVGSSLEQGAPGWRLNVDSRTVDMLSPVAGEVVEVNKRVLERPELVNEDPYGEGWLVAIKPRDRAAAFKNLLGEGLAKAWTDMSVGSLMARMGGELGTVYQDGGSPVAGIARIIAPDDWDSMVKTFFLTD